MVREWAAAAKGAVRLAMVVQAELIDPQNFGVLAARNAGLIGNVFTEEPQARAWLAAQVATEKRDD